MKRRDGGGGRRRAGGGGGGGVCSAASDSCLFLFRPSCFFAFSRSRSRHGAPGPRREPPGSQEQQGLEAPRAAVDKVAVEDVAGVWGGLADELEPEVSFFFFLKKVSFSSATPRKKNRPPLFFFSLSLSLSLSLSHVSSFFSHPKKPVLLTSPARRGSVRACPRRRRPERGPGARPVFF